MSSGAVPTSLSLELPFPGTGQRVRIVGSLDVPEWIAADVCAALGLENVGEALSSIPWDEKGKVHISNPDTPNKTKTFTTVKEAGLYRLIFKSRKEAAQRFQKFVVSEVLPAIRRQGYFGADFGAGLEAAAVRLRTLELAERVLSIGGVVEDRDRVLLQDSVRNLLTDGSQAALTATQPATIQQVTISARCEELGFRVNGTRAAAIGRVAAKLYRERHGRKPERHTQMVGGAARLVSTYTRADIDIIDSAIVQVLGPVSTPSGTTIQ